MNESNRCSQCGAPLPKAGATCPRCLLSAGLEVSEDHQLGPSFLNDLPEGPKQPQEAGSSPSEHAAAFGGRAAPSVPLKEKIGDWIGCYKLLQQIGEGGCGVVYMADQQEPIKRRVALKVIKLGMDTRQIIARFEAERQALALMDHPHIAKVLDAGATGTGRPYFVMELVKGIKITEFCDQNHLDTKERLDLFIQVCHAIQHAHQKGIIHRDIKPSNILVTLLDGMPVPKVIDFGIAKATQQPLTDKSLLTSFQQFIGTPAYMSPEQAGLTSDDIDTRSDIYGLGVLLYELITGNTPFERKELLQAGFDEIRRLIREKEPPKPSTRLSLLAADDLTTVAKRHRTEPPKLIHLVRGDLDWIVMKALEKDRTRRYDTANDLGQDILRHLNNEPVLARPPRNFYRFQKLVRRNKLTFAAASAVTAALIIGLGLSTWLFLKEKEARQRAVAAENVSRTEARQAQAARLEAQRANSSLRDTVTRLYVQNAETLFRADTSRRGLAYLARALRDNPANQTAAARLLSAMNQRSFPLPVHSAIKHKGKIVAADFSPDGRQILTGSADGTARIWDAESGRTNGAPLEHDGPVTSARFSPSGRFAVTTTTTGAVRVWKVGDGAALLRDFGPQGYKDVFLASFSPDGAKVAVTSGAGGRILDSNDGRVIMTFPSYSRAFEDQGRDFAFSPDGTKILVKVVNDGRDIRVYDANTGRPLTEKLELNAPFDVLAAKFGSDDEELLAFLAGGPIRTWGTEGGKPLNDQTAQLAGEIVSLGGYCVSPDGLRVATMENWVIGTRIRDTRTLDSVAPQMRHDLVGFTAFSDDGLKLLSASHYFGTFRIWDSRTGEPLTELTKNDGKMDFARFTPDGSRMAIISSNSLSVWDIQDGAAKAVLFNHSSPPVFEAGISADGKRLITTCGEATVSEWDVHTGRLLTNRVDKGRTSDIWRLHNTQEELTERSTPFLPIVLSYNKDVSFFEYSGDRKRIVLMFEDNSAQVFESRFGQPLSEPFRQSAGNEAGVTFGPDGEKIVCTAPNGTVAVFDLPICPLPIPKWLPEFAETLAGMRLTEAGVLEEIPVKRLLTMKAELASTSGSGFYEQWLRWFLADRATRKVSFTSEMSVQEHIAGRIRQKSFQSLLDALKLSPTNVQAVAKLARWFLGEQPADDPDRGPEAQFFSRRAVILAPQSPDAWQCRAEVLEDAGRIKEALAATETAIRQAPTNAALWLTKVRLLEWMDRPDDAKEALSKALQVDPAATLFEAHIPQGAETDPIALNLASGWREVPNSESLERVRSEFEIHRFDSPNTDPWGLRIKRQIEGVFEVSRKNEAGHYFPPDFAGVGPFYVVKERGRSYALTPANFGQIFGPITNTSEVFPYLKAYEALFGDKFAQIVTEDFVREKPKETPESPKLTRIEETSVGFRVTLVLYTVVHQQAYYSRTLLLKRNGTIKVLNRDKILKQLNGGIMF